VGFVVDVTGELIALQVDCVLIDVGLDRDVVFADLFENFILLLIFDEIGELLVFLLDFLQTVLEGNPFGF
jgi:hypothetical protein